MFISQKASLMLLALGMGAVALLGFQNCSQARFTPDEDSMILRTEEPPGAGSAGVGDGSGSPLPPSDPSVPAISPTPVASQPTPTPSGPSTDPSVDDPSTEDPSCDRNKLVECQMLHPNRKIVLGSDLTESPSNAVSHRVCMSEKACLQLINQHASYHNCSLGYGEGVAPSDPQLQCTEIFPGSKGTCKNAKRLSDEEVLSHLEVLSSK